MAEIREKEIKEEGKTEEQNKKAQDGVPMMIEKATEKVKL